MTGPAQSSECVAIGGPEAGLTLTHMETGDPEILRLAGSFAEIDPWASYGYGSAALANYFAAQEPGAPRYKIQVSRETAGVAGVRLRWLRGPYLQFLGVLPRFQGSGLGSAVLAWLEADARRSAERNLWVAASDINARAIAFYRRHGFEVAASLDGLVVDARTELLLRKRL